MGWSAIQAARLAGCTPAQVDAWRRIGLLEPDAAADDPSAPYSFRDLVALRMVASLLDAGLPMARIRRAVSELLAHGEDFTGLRLVTDGETVWACRDDGQILEALHHGQLALFVAVDRLADDVSTQVHVFDAERAAFVDDLRARRDAATNPAPDPAPDPSGTGHPCRG